MLNDKRIPSPLVCWVQVAVVGEACLDGRLLPLRSVGRLDVEAAYMDPLLRTVSVWPVSLSLSSVRSSSATL